MNKKEKSKIIFLSGLITLLIILCIYALNGFAPFGTKTLAVMDANIQYIDFFSYLKDVIAGKNSITYSFGKTLGGSNVAVFSYIYLHHLIYYCCFSLMRISIHSLILLSH